MPDDKPEDQNKDPQKDGNWEDQAAKAGWLSPEQQNNVVKNRLAREREKHAAERQELEERASAAEAAATKAQQDAQAGRANGDEGAAELEQRVAHLEKKNEAQANRIVELEGDLKKRDLDGQRADAIGYASEAGFLDPNDAWAHLKGSVTPDGTMLDADGSEAFDKDGNPLTLKAAVEGLAKSKPHLVGDRTVRGPGFQGSRDARKQGSGDIDAQIADAEAKGDFRRSIALKAQKQKLGQ